MASYTKYIPELEDGQGNIYGLKDTDARELIGNLSSAIDAFKAIGLNFEDGVLVIDPVTE